jgi:hypothetical protein
MTKIPSYWNSVDRLKLGEASLGQTQSQILVINPFSASLVSAVVVPPLLNYFQWCNHVAILITEKSYIFINILLETDEWIYFLQRCQNIFTQKRLPMFHGYHDANNSLMRTDDKCNCYLYNILWSKYELTLLHTIQKSWQDLMSMFFQCCVNYCCWKCITK